MEYSNFFQEDKIKIVENNISYLMSINNITSPKELAKLIDVAPTTVYSYLKSPLSNSSVKAALCKYFGITVYQLENDILSESEYFKTSRSDISKNGAFNIPDSDKPLMSMNSSEIYELVKDTKCDDFSYKEKIKELKENISKKLHFKFKYYLMKAKESFDSGDFEEAYDNMTDAWWNMQDNDLEVITAQDIDFYVELCRESNQKDGLKKLIIILTNEKFFNINILLFLASKLESIYPDLAFECYDIVNTK